MCQMSDLCRNNKLYVMSVFFLFHYFIMIQLIGDMQFVSPQKFITVKS